VEEALVGQGGRLAGGQEGLFGGGRRQGQAGAQVVGHEEAVFGLPTASVGAGEAGQAQVEEALDGGRVEPGTGWGLLAPGLEGANGAKGALQFVEGQGPVGGEEEVEGLALGGREGGQVALEGAGVGQGGVDEGDQVGLGGRAAGVEAAGLGDGPQVALGLGFEGRA